MTEVTITVNGDAQTHDVEDRTLLVHFLRDHVGLTGTHVGCDTTQCGACTVHLDGKAVKSCTILAVAVDGAEVRTIEGMAEQGVLSAIQQAFKDHHGLQCGFCTPGMVMAGADMIRRYDGQLDEHTIREELDGNICRCTGYTNIVKALLSAAESHRATAS
ncbi:(2Fe-2S)-binding protein [Celeribacter litoreus]|uniref:(2Fe-2S)-binding protein n=1 Tax=Celeribacter litoreus TaxID=2876714 RepID=UPI001CCA8FE2|nr:(2Fe-2S)-binding protein [Celeribacter litoreus]MCA0043390.1 (2Fe-2S)-binding protein [Celeribacter litoreus]